MPKHITRRVNGVDYGRDEFLRHLVRTIESIIKKKVNRKEGATIQEIAYEWRHDPDWREPHLKQTLTLDLTRLSKDSTRHPIFRHVGPGAYAIRPRYYQIGGPRLTDELAKKAFDYLFEGRGIATFTEIRKHLGIDAQAGTLRDEWSVKKPNLMKRRARAEPGATYSVGYKALHDSIARHPLIFTEMGHNTVMLHPLVLDMIPLTGRAFSWLTAMTVTDAFRHSAGLGPSHTVEVRTDIERRFFRNVGWLASRIREARNLSLDHVVNRPGMREAIQAISEKHPNRPIYEEMLTLDHIAKDTYSITYYEAWEEGLRWDELLLRLFEQGDLYTHMNAERPFYDALASALRLDPIALSRGYLSRGTRLTQYPKTVAGELLDALDERPEIENPLEAIWLEELQSDADRLAREAEIETPGLIPLYQDQPA